MFAAASNGDNGPARSPLAPALFLALSRIGNNLNQIASGMDFGDFRDRAVSVRHFAELWAKALRIEADSKGPA